MAKIAVRARGYQAKQYGAGSRTTEIEQRGRGDYLGDGGLLLVRDLRHGRNLHEIEIIEQADPQDTEDHMDPAEQESPEADLAENAVVASNQEYDEGQDQPEAQSLVEIFQPVLHRASPLPWSRRHGRSSADLTRVAAPSLRMPNAGYCAISQALRKGTDGYSFATCAQNGSKPMPIAVSAAVRPVPKTHTASNDLCSASRVTTARIRIATVWANTVTPELQ